ncbi:MAG: hypothetical protein JWO32_2221 [Bacteroidetes bacterium]|nr:hypothetical protein [Bacteroidota bacterium]
MKIKLFVILNVLLLSFSNCKKSKIVVDGIDVTKAVDSGILFSTWIINDDDDKKEKATANSNYFTGKVKPEITFSKSGSYDLVYLVSGVKTTETGTWFTDKASNQLVLKSNGKESNFLINELDEEDFVLTNVYTAVKTVTNKEGVVTSQTQTVKEMLYMEDND